MNEVLKIILTIFGSAIVFIPLGMLTYKMILKSKKKNAVNEAETILEKARLEAETAYKNEIIKSKEEALRIKNLADEEVSLKELFLLLSTIEKQLEKVIEQNEKASDALVSKLKNELLSLMPVPPKKEEA